MITITKRISRAFSGAGLIFVIAGVGGSASAHDTDKIVPRVGLKSVEVISNDLRLFGITTEAIELIDDSDAAVNMLLDNDAAYFLVDRETGVVNLSKSSPMTQEFLQLRIPPMQLFPVPEPSGTALRVAGLVGIALLAAWKRGRHFRSAGLQPPIEA